ncbi:clustered mitochondria protein-like protein [Tanacetum coccineum]
MHIPNGLKVTKAYQEADVPRLNNLAMAIVGYRGHRVVAQVVNLSGPKISQQLKVELARSRSVNLLVAGEKLGDVFSKIAARLLWYAKVTFDDDEEIIDITEPLYNDVMDVGIKSLLEVTADKIKTAERVSTVRKERIKIDWRSRLLT